jgi:hypothetical protein
MQPRRFLYLRTQVIEPTNARPLLVKDPGEYGAGSISVRQEEGGERRRYFDHAPRTRFRRSAVTIISFSHTFTQSSCSISDHRIPAKAAIA